MLKVFLFLTTILVTSSCGGFKLFTPKAPAVDRKIASLMLNDEDQTFIEEVDEKLLALHSYYVIGQKNLLEFDRLVSESKLEKLYQSKSYLKLQAVKSQVEIIETELSVLFQKSGKKDILKKRLEEFSKHSKLASLSLENIREKLFQTPLVSKQDVQFQDVAKEYRDLEVTREFSVYDKSIEHLSLRSSDDSSRKTNLPPKVWALAFRTAKNQEQIESNLKKNNLKGTFLTDTQEELEAWNVDTLDWMAQTPDRIIRRTLSLMKKTSHDSGVIVFHSVHGRTALAAGGIMGRFKESKRRTCTLSEIAKDLNQGSDKVCLNN